MRPTSFGVSTSLKFLRDKDPTGNFQLVGHNAFNGILNQESYYLVYNPSLDRVLIYEDEGLSLMVNLVPAGKEDGMQPYDLYFYPDLDLAKKADLLHVYLAFRVAKILEANAINRKIDKENDALRGSR